MAVDFRARIALGGFDPHFSAAAAGVANLPGLLGQVENGAHRARILEEAFAVAVELLDVTSDSAGLDRAALLLAFCEQIYRGGAEVLNGSVGDACDFAADGQAFADGLDERSLADLRSLMETNHEQLEEWIELMSDGERFEPNPSFAGSDLVGGADGDWLIGDVLVDAKAYNKLTAPTLRGFLRQLLGYVMLDVDDALGIRRVGIWLPRQSRTATWSLDLLLGGDPDVMLPSLRAGFQRAAGGAQIAVRVPVSQRRKDQLLSDNPHTPGYMLKHFADGEDADLRFRVGRNIATPEVVVRQLAGDRLARVREGVAKNERAPYDVLDELSRDRSIGVRRAVAANRGAPRTLLKALTSNSDRTVQRTATANDGVARLDSPNSSQPYRPVSDRDEGALDTQWFADFLRRTSGSNFYWDRELPIPEASKRWATMTGRSVDRPAWISQGLPKQVRADLLREGRPKWIRRSIARDWPAEDSDARYRFLSDADPEIRWDALQRSVDLPQDALGPLLTELAGDRRRRVQFRTDGDDRPQWQRSTTPSQHDHLVLMVVAAHPSTPLASIRVLTQHKSIDVVAALITNPSVPAENVPALIARLRFSRSVDARERVASSEMLPAVAADALVEDKNGGVRAALAGNHAAPPRALLRLAEDPDFAVRLAVLENASTPAALAASVAPPLLEASANLELLMTLNAIKGRVDVTLPAEMLSDALNRLSKSRLRDPDLRIVSARDPRTAAPTLERLAKSVDEDVRSAVASNPTASSALIEKLASDQDPSVRTAAAKSAAAEVSVLVSLAHDDDTRVRANAASNPALPSRVLAELLADDSLFVRMAASENPATLAEDIQRAEETRKSSSATTERSLAELHEMAASTRAEIRIRVAYEPRTPPDILKFLAGDRRSANVRRAVAANPNTAPEILRSLADDTDDEVRHAVAFNEATPAGLLLELADRSVDLAILVALNPDAPTEVLAGLAHDSDPLIGHVAREAQTSRSLEPASDSGGEITPQLG
ncbi:hypothetical protein J7E25_05840 [Agromyces sp. ISL-38]|uniref:variant leucine-rich repeat-containing protein n=1 Tax=Agromyces sp. ISL-38 TaxID=2819107 RepID=UPI001BE8A9DA|nr:hypothetical protein [Agromyces sp. ISL-38]MBT2498610.1 hypothetical protein [Agromyces sp. ISL-38]